MAKEEAEIAILSEFLPQPLSDDELRGPRRRGHRRHRGDVARDIGKVMGWLSPRTRGRADGKQVSELVAQRLARTDLAAHDTAGSH